MIVLLGLCGLAVLTFMGIYLLATKCPRLLAWLGGGLLLLFLASTTLMWMSFEPVHRPAVNQSEYVQFTDHVHAGPLPGAYAYSSDWNRTGLRFGRFSTIGIILIVVLGLAIVKALRRHHHAEHRPIGGLLIACIIVVLIFLAWMFFAVQPSRVAIQRERAHQAMELARQRVESARHATERATQQAMDAAQHQIEKLPQGSGESDAGHSLRELYDQFTKPHIQLEADDRTAEDANDNQDSAPAETELEPQGATTSRTGGTALAATPAQPTSAEAAAESIDRSLERVELLVERTATIAHEVSELGTMLGRAMVALREPFGSVSSAAHADAAEVAASDVTPVASEAPSSQPTRSKRVVAAAVATGISGQKVAASRTDTHAHDPSDHNDIARNAKSAPSDSPRPAWVDDPPKRVGNVSREVIVVGDYATTEECYRATDVYLLLATHDHLMEMTGEKWLSDQSRPSLDISRNVVRSNGELIIVNGVVRDDRLRRLARANIGIDLVRREIAKDEYLETVDRSVGEMKKLYTLVEFTPSVDRDLRDRWIALRREDRFAAVGVGAGSILGLIGLAFGLLKIDTWTKGYYTKRLFLGVPAAIIGLVTLLAIGADAHWW